VKATWLGRCALDTPGLDGAQRRHRPGVFLSFAYPAAERLRRDTPQSTLGSLPAPAAPRETGVSIILLPIKPIRHLQPAADSEDTTQPAENPRKHGDRLLR